MPLVSMRKASKPLVNRYKETPKLWDFSGYILKAYLINKDKSNLLKD